MDEIQQKVQDAALRLFAERGYETTSVDDIAAAVGLSRSTFFRMFGSKEAAVFADHEHLLEQVKERLDSQVVGDPVSAVVDAVRLVLRHFLQEGERARARYVLTSRVPGLRDRELVSSARYQLAFRRYLSSRGDGSETAELRAELVAGAVVAAHNHVLRRWLRGEANDPERELDAALTFVHERATESAPAAGPAAVVVVPAGASMMAIEHAVRQALVRGGELVASSPTFDA